jgi:hypothetical protein
MPAPLKRLNETNHRFYEFFLNITQAVLRYDLWTDNAKFVAMWKQRARVPVRETGGLALWFILCFLKQLKMSVGANVTLKP